MKIEVKTKTGSVYILDNVQMTWERVSRTDKSGKLRSNDKGPLSEWPIVEVGEGVQMYGPPLTEGASFRWIYTSDVQSWKEIM